MHMTLSSLLMDVEYELRQLQLWQLQPPEVEALLSAEPFCIDTLSLPQWVQFVFIPRMKALIDSRQELPGACGVVPIAEEYFSGSGLPVDSLLVALLAIDELLSEHSMK